MKQINDLQSRDMKTEYDFWIVTDQNDIDIDIGIFNTETDQWWRFDPHWSMTWH